MLHWPHFLLSPVATAFSEISPQTCDDVSLVSDTNVGLPVGGRPDYLGSRT